MRMPVLLSSVSCRDPRCEEAMGDLGSALESDIHVCLQVREILLQASQQGPEAELPTAPQSGEQPLPLLSPQLKSTTPRQGNILPAAKMGSL